MHGLCVPALAIPAVQGNRVEAMTASSNKIPAELRSLCQWVCWRLEARDGKSTKVPYHPSGSRADATDPATWSSFADVTATGAMRKLVSAMAQTAAPRTFSELIKLAREQGLFEHIIGVDDGELGRREKSTLGNLLSRYDRRLVSKHRFVVEGRGKTRRYRVENGNGGDEANSVSDENSSLCAGDSGRKHHSDHSDHSQSDCP